MKYVESGQEVQLGRVNPAPEARNNLAQRFSAGFAGPESNPGGMT